MTTNQQKLYRLQVRQSEAREKLSTLDAKPDRSTDEQTELERLDGELRGLEPEFRDALKAVDSEQTAAVTVNDSEARELRELTGRASVGDVLLAALEKRATTGAIQELQAAHNLGPNQIPLEMLRLPTEARAVSTAPTSVGAQESEIVAPVFASGAGSFFGLDRPQVSMGDAVYPVLTSRPTVGGPHANSTDVAETTGAFDADLLAPGRIQASFVYRRTDAARFVGMDASLRQALNMGLEEKSDQEFVNGSNGLLNGTNLPNNNAAAVTTFANYISQFCYARVDGRFASMKSDLRILMGSATYAHAGGVYRAAESDVTALDRLSDQVGGVRVSAHVPDVASKKQNAVVRLGSRRDAVQPMWTGVTIIVDEVTRSGAGEIEVTAVMLLATKIIRAGGYWKGQTQHP